CLDGRFERGGQAFANGVEIGPGAEVVVVTVSPSPSFPFGDGGDQDEAGAGGSGDGRHVGQDAFCSLRAVEGDQYGLDHGRPLTRSSIRPCGQKSAEERQRRRGITSMTTSWRRPSGSMAPPWTRPRRMKPRDSAAASAWAWTSPTASNR